MSETRTYQTRVNYLVQGQSRLSVDIHSTFTRESDASAFYWQELEKKPLWLRLERQTHESIFSYSPNFLPPNTLNKKNRA